MTRMRVPLTIALLASVPAFAGSPDAMDGVWKHRFPNALVSGEKYQSEDILEVVPYQPGAAYFRLHLEFFNGHVCDLAGIGTREKDTLTYRAAPDDQGRQCVLTIRRANDGVRISEDQTHACRDQSCGARGSYGIHPNAEPDFAASERRPIRYLARLLASSEYAAAVDEYKKQSK